MTDWTPEKHEAARQIRERAHYKILPQTAEYLEEALDEIERLQAENRKLKAEVLDLELYWDKS